MKRKDFLLKIGGVLISLPIISVVGCSSSDDAAPAPIPTPIIPVNPSGNCDNGAATSISSNHGHSLAVAAVDVQAGVEKTYMIQGTSGHDHSITLTAANFTTLGSGQGLDIVSTAGGGHTHIVTVFCV